MFKAGILYPQSTIYPLLGADLLDGIRTSLNQQKENHIELISIPIGFGADEKEVYQVTEKLLLQDHVELIIGFVEHKLARLLQPLFTATGKIFLVVNVGANYPHNWVAPPGTFYITLLNCFLTRLAGKLAVEDGNKQAALAVSFYDGGYLHCSTMVNGFCSAGGTINYNYISPQRTDQFDLGPLTDQFRDPGSKIQSLLCLFSGPEARMFYESFSTAGITIPPLYVSPMMLEENLLMQLERELPLTIKGYIPWHSSIDTDANHFFKTAFTKHSGRQASIFSLLGWESGVILREIFHSSIKNANWDPSKLVDPVFQTPRGPARIDKETHYLLPPVYKAEPGMKKSVILEEKESGAEWAEFISAEKEVPASGWNNIYLCY